MSDAGIKKDWIVVGDDGTPIYDTKIDRPKAFPTAKAAIKEAKILVQTTEAVEAWVYCLSHVVARPTTDPTVDVVK